MRKKMTNVMYQTASNFQGMVKALITSPDWPKLRNTNGSFGMETQVEVDEAKYVVVFEFLPVTE
jgi:hypothetical protein